MLYLPGAVFKIAYEEISDSFHVMLVWIGNNEYRLICLDDANIFSTRTLTDTDDEEWNGFTLEELRAYIQLGTKLKIELTYIKNIKDIVF